MKTKIALISLLLVPLLSPVFGESFESIPILPHAKIYDVTQSAFGAIPDDGIDDTMAIQAALNAAAEASNKEGATKQQIVYLPKGEYHVRDTLAFPKNTFNKSKQGYYECFQWLHGDGANKTIIRLREASDSGKVLGSEAAPKPVVQTAEYRLDNKAGGNVNFQLWVTDLGIIVPDDQPYAVGLSFGSANMGGVRNVVIRAEGNGGHTGLGLVQYNNGPGYLEHVKIYGFKTGLEINDNWGESYTFSDIVIENQRAGGAGISMTDKLIAMENVIIKQKYRDVTGIHLLDTPGGNSACGGVPHLTLVNAHLENTHAGGSLAPAFRIQPGHTYLRNITTRGYGENIMLDHGKQRSFPHGRIEEFVSIHGKSMNEASNVAISMNDGPLQSLNLVIKSTPEIPSEAWRALDEGDYTQVKQMDLQNHKLSVSTSWVLVNPGSEGDDTALLQAALDSGARYVGLLNEHPFNISGELIINGQHSPKKVELIYGLMSEIIVDSGFADRSSPFDKTNPNCLLTLETGNIDTLFIKGIRVDSESKALNDFQLIQNNAAHSVVFEDFRCKVGPRHYRNGAPSYDQDIFIENVEWAYNQAFPETCNIFTKQNVWCRNFNSEMNITPDPVVFERDKTTFKLSRFSVKPKIVNQGGRLWSFGQKVGEYNGVFVETGNGGRTELLSIFFNESVSEFFPPSREAVCLVVNGADSALSVVGQERPRGMDSIPHENTFAIVESGGTQQILQGTNLPSYLRYDSHDPFADKDVQRYLSGKAFRVVGLLRVGQ